MASAENVFPKIGNDPLYNSEINRFHSMGFLASGGISNKSSGTAWQETGSAFISGGTINVDKALIGIYWDVTGAGPAEAPNEIQVIISGTGNETIPLGSNLAGTDGFGYSKIPFYPSTIERFALSDSYTPHKVMIKKTAKDLNPGSDFTIHFQIRTSRGAIQFSSYSINYEGWT